MKIAFITTDWANSKHREENNEYGGVGYYRAIKPAEYLRKLGHEVHVYGSNLKDHVKGDTLFDGYAKFVKKFDVIVIKQSDSRNTAQLIGACKETKTPIAMDIDDNFVEVFKGQPALEMGYDRGGLKKGFAMAAMSMVDAVFVSTEPLKEYFSRELKELFNIDMPFFVLPNCNDIKDWDFTTTTSDKLFIGWHGSITHDEDLKVVLPAIKQIMKKNKDVYLQLCGGVRQESVVDLFKGWEEEAERVQIVGGTPSWQGFPELLMSLPWDIAIAPLVDNEFNRGKSNIKWLETACKGVPLVASDVYPYRSIKHSENGFLCASRAAFRKTLEKLIENKELREKVGENARKEIETNWQYKDKIGLWEKALKKVKTSRVV